MVYPESLQEYAIREITHRIQTGEYPVGSRLVVQKIADSLHISNTPVVAAINQLAARGLVELTPRKGAVVREFSVQDIYNYFDARIMIECHAAKRAVQNVDRFPELIREMKELVDQFDVLSPTDLEGARVLETKFHNDLVQMAGNPQLGRLYEFNWSIGSVYFLYSVGKVAPECFQISLLEHRRILEALLAGDEKRLEFLIQDHLRFLKKVLGWNP